MHAELGIGHLHTPHQFLDLVGQGVEFISLTLEGEHGGLLVGGLHG
jgi:hypothetical protein